MYRVLLGISAAVSGLLLFGLLLLNAGEEMANSIVAPGTESNVITCVNANGIAESKIAFPYAVPGTDLVIDRTATYEGPFLEDGSNQEVSDVMAVVLCNRGDKGIAHVKIVLEQENKKLYFEAETIPPFQSVLALEKYKSKNVSGGFTDCNVDMTLEDEAWWAENAPKIQQQGMDQLSVINDSSTAVENVWIYYKTYSDDPAMYIGGITYKVGIQKLLPGQILLIKPPFYVVGYCRIARVTVG